MQSKLKIPKILKVGYVNREDTYTGKLAYVTQIDEKGKHRCETSWNSWRNKDLEPDDFDNTPISGFVLNKKAGDYRGGWNGRSAWIRVYDPRGFEFEISVNNLLFILQETSAIQGKGLEGEFIYSWSGKDIVLLPTCSQDYIESTKYTDLQTKKVGKKDMTEGCLYQNKDNEKVMYMGRHSFIEYSWADKPQPAVKLHIFRKEDGSYWPQKGFTKLAVKLADEPAGNFAEAYIELMESRHFHLAESAIKVPFTSADRWGVSFLYKGNFDYFYRLRIFKLDNEIHVRENGMCNLSVGGTELIMIKAPTERYYPENKSFKLSEIIPSLATGITTEEQLRGLGVFKFIVVNKYGKECFNIRERE